MCRADSSYASNTRDAEDSNHECVELDVDSISLTDILLEFDVHYGEAMSQIKQTVTAVSTSPTCLTQVNGPIRQYNLYSFVLTAVSCVSL